MPSSPDRSIIDGILLPSFMAVFGLIAKLFGEGTLSLIFMIFSCAAVLCVFLISKRSRLQQEKHEQEKELEKLRQDHASETERIRQDHRSEVEKLRREHEAEIQKNAQLTDTTVFKDLHIFVHNSRDTGVKLMPIVPKYSNLIPSGLPKGSQLPALKEIETDVLQIMQKLLDVFQAVLPNERELWIAIRDRRSDDCYHTWLRKGSFNPNRQDSSRPMHKDDSSTISELKRYYKFEFKCVKITGCEDMYWKTMPNDDYEEDNSVLMGAVMTRSWDSGKKSWLKGHNCLSWVITVNSPNKHVFNASHVPIMQTAIDSFAWLANQAARKQHLLNKVEDDSKSDQ